MPEIWNPNDRYILQAPPPASTMFTTELEYDGDKISGYAGSAFKAGTDLEFGYDSADNISAINSSAISQTPSQKLYLQSPLTYGMSGTSAYIGILSADFARMLGVDETVLWSGTSAGTTAAVLSESYKNFNKVKIGYCDVNDRETFIREFLPDFQRNDTIDFEGYRYAAGSIYYKHGQYILTDTTMQAGGGMWYYTRSNGSITTADGNNIILLGITGVGRKN